MTLPPGLDLARVFVIVAALTFYDAEYTCPRCGRHFRGMHHEGLGSLQEAVDHMAIHVEDPVAWVQQFADGREPG